MTVHLELIGLPGRRLLFAPARYLFECGMNIHAHLSPARLIFAPLRRDVPQCSRGDGADGTRDAGMSSPEIICLLLARNEEDGSRGYLEWARLVCDAIVALDHGSTDATADILHAGPLVPRVISRPPRQGNRGWHDGHNRNLLLRTPDGLDPRWVLCLDADERIDADDARVLGEFVACDGLPGCGYREATFSNGSHPTRPAP
jgi:hypothetical protein